MNNTAKRSYIVIMLERTEAPIHFRPFEMAKDLPALIQLQARIEAIDQTGEDVSEEAITSQVQLPGHDPELDRWVATVSYKEEQVIGVGSVWKVPQNTHADVYVGVDPAWRRQGIGSELLHRTLKRAQTLLPRYTLASVDVRHQGAVAFLRKHAFGPLGTSYTLMRLAADRHVPHPEWPVGYCIRPYNPDGDFPLLLEMYNRAFKGLWGHWDEVQATDLQAIIEQQNPACIFLLYAQTGEAVGTCRAEISPYLSTRRGKPTGYLDAPAVIPEQRENNLYLPQLLHAIHWLRSEAPQIPLDIELESWGDDPRVLAAYEQAGFEKVQQQDIYAWQEP